MVYFILFRVAFLVYHSSTSAHLPIETLGGVFIHGSKMDLSFTAYLSLVTFLLIMLTVLTNQLWVPKLLKGYTLVTLLLVTFLQIADLELFREWGFRLDATPLTYINTPTEMAISASSSPYGWLLSSIIVISLVFYWWYQKFIHRILYLFPRISPYWGILLLLFTLGLIIPIRGGFQLAPLNQSVAFFSKNDFANQAALNVPWNVFRSITQEVHTNHNPYQELPQAKAKQLVSQFYGVKDAKSHKVLNHERPNIIIILWESLTSKALSELGGDHRGVLPKFQQLIPQGILFSNFYASGDRSDKGLVAILSGFPAQPRKSIVKIPNKSSQLPILTQDFNDLGYHTSFYHGGELEFANIKTYLINGKFDRVVGKDSFFKRDMNSKWGAHDHVVLEKALQQLNGLSSPFFTVIFTLSSHEPFEIPIESKFPGDDLTNKYLSSLHYADQSVGEFIEKAKQMPWYDQTLIIILADHGHRLLGNDHRYQAEKYHIPMLWLGGALELKDTVITKYCSQTDLAKTLLNQINIDDDKYIWSRDIFDNGSKEGAFYVFNDGISFIDHQGITIYDYQSKAVMESSTKVSASRLALTKSHLQTTYQDYLDK